MNKIDIHRRLNTKLAVAHMAYDAGYYSQAIRHFRLVLSILESEEANDSMKARAMTGLAKSLAAIGKYEEAEPMIRQALLIDENLPEASTACAEDYHQLALLYWRSGRNAESQEYAERALKLVERAGKHAPDELKAKLLKHFAVLAEQAGNTREAERHLNKAIEFIEYSSQLGKQSMIYGDVLLVKVLFLAEQGRFEEAEELYPQAIQIIAITRGPAHPRVEEAMNIFREMQASQLDATSNHDRTKKIETAREASHHGIL